MDIPTPMTTFSHQGFGYKNRVKKIYFSQTTKQPVENQSWDHITDISGQRKDIFDTREGRMTENWTKIM